MRGVHQPRWIMNQQDLAAGYRDKAQLRPGASREVQAGASRPCLPPSTEVAEHPNWSAVAGYGPAPRHAGAGRA